MYPRIIVTSGEPAGIGPDLCLALAKQHFDAQLVIAADPAILSARAKVLGLTTIDLQTYHPTLPAKPTAENQLLVLPIKSTQPVTPGQLNPANASYVLKVLDAAIKGCQQLEFAAMVTAPIHKGVINDCGITFSGHTEYLATVTNTQQVVMMLASKQLRVALTTTHLPLKDVPTAITSTLLEQIITVLHQDLQQKFGIIQPRILVCGLNPHAGEGGHLGKEELETITPTINRLTNQFGFNLTGPLPADTAFTEKPLSQADAVLAMYHDQGLPVLKYAGFGHAVNITLGLPFIRTSVDHGTALDLAGTGTADSGSLFTAIEYAINMSQSQQG
nr:4-hydroxythreonine-4-phosphate dehydrogenase PdxA [Spartinivicinus ruber]